MTEAQIAIAVAVLSVGVAIYTALTSRKQAQQAEKDVQLSIQSSKSDAVLHFTDRFFDLLKVVDGGDIEFQILKHNDWAYQFWSLQSTEFYFFHHGILPTFMYSLWIVDLAELYVGASGTKIRASHMKYLKQYSLNYDEMNAFFDYLFQLASQQTDKAKRNNEIALWIEVWIKEHQQSVLK